MELDGLPSTVMPPTAVTFDLTSMSQAQVHNDPILVKIFMQILYSHGFSGHCLRWPWDFSFWPRKLISTSMNPNTSVTKIGRNSFIDFWDNKVKVTRSFSHCLLWPSHLTFWFHKPKLISTYEPKYTYDRNWWNSLEWANNLWQTKIFYAHIISTSVNVKWTTKIK